MEQILLETLRASLVDARPIPRKRLANLHGAVAPLHALLESFDADAPDALMARGGDAFAIDDAFGADGMQSRPLRQARLLEEEFRLVLERNNDSQARLASQEQLLARVRARVQGENRRVVGIASIDKIIMHLFSFRHCQPLITFHPAVA